MITTIDFETEDADSWHPLPPKPVGVSIKKGAGASRYYAWGHPMNNNTTLFKVSPIIKKAMRGHAAFHNAKFDIAVAMHWLGCEYPSRVEDTLFLAYLDDPRRRSLALKTLADEELGIPPDEQEDLRDWLFENVKGAKQAKKNWGKYICKAPGDLVGVYARGDTDRTYALLMHYQGLLEDDGLKSAYERELKLLPVIMDMEKQGVPISPEIHNELERREKQLESINQFLHKRLGDVNLGHGVSLFNALDYRGLIDHDLVEYTDKGNPKTGREQIEIICSDKKIVENIGMRSRLVKIIGTYLRPWAEAQSKHGRYFPYFNQTRNAKGGTRTGRLSSDFQQVPKQPDEEFGLTYLRNFVMPEEGHVIVSRDYSQQELRILAHYAEGDLLQAYIDDPGLDVHDLVRDLITDIVGIKYPRKYVKNANFLQVYGGGVPALASNIGCSEAEARPLKKAHGDALPEVKSLTEEVTRQLKEGVLLRTWGGRLYDVEEGMSKQGRWEKLYYKLINVLIQGSAADQTKELMINYYFHPKRKGRILVQVHDELICSVPKRYAKQEMKLIQNLMDDSTHWDVPMRSDGKIGPSWGEAKKYED